MKLAIITCLCVCASLFHVSIAFLKFGLSSSHAAPPTGKVLIDPGLAIYPTTGKIYSGPVVLTNVKVVGSAQVPAAHGAGSGDGSDFLGGISDGIHGAIRKGSDVVENVVREFGELFDQKLQSLNENLDPIREKFGEIKNGMGTPSLGDKLLQKIAGSGLNNGGPMPSSYGNRIVYMARARNNRNAVYPKSGHFGQPVASGIGGPRWTPSNCPNVYVGLGFTPDPCPNKIPPCGNGCGSGQSSCNGCGNNAASAGGWA